MSGAAAPDAKHHQFTGRSRDDHELIHQKERLCPSGHTTAWEKLSE